jgi:hypothetical protein
MLDAVGETLPQHESAATVIAHADPGKRHTVSAKGNPQSRGR